MLTSGGSENSSCENDKSREGSVMDFCRIPWNSLSAQDKRDRLLVIELIHRLRSGEKFRQL